MAWNSFDFIIVLLFNITWIMFDTKIWLHNSFLVETNQEHIDSGVEHFQGTLTTESVDAKQRHELRR